MTNSIISAPCRLRLRPASCRSVSSCCADTCYNVDVSGFWPKMTYSNQLYPVVLSVDYLESFFLFSKKFRYMSANSSF